MKVITEKINECRLEKTYIHQHKRLKAFQKISSTSCFSELLQDKDRDTQEINLQQWAPTAG